MGKHKIGKLYLHWSRRGIAYKWGDDGDIHRFTFRQSAQGNNRQVYSADDNDSYQYDGSYDANGAAYYEEPSRLSILWEHPYLFWVLLIVFPPLGIWALWKRQQYDPLPRSIISALSLVWFIILIAWIIGNLAGPGDQITPPVSNMLSNIPPTEPTPNPDGGEVDDVGTLSLLGPDTGTPAPTDAAEEIDEASTYVYISSSGSGSYYHKEGTCNGLPYSQHVTLKFAKEKELTACPECLGGGDAEIPENVAEATYYATANGKHYHTISGCSGMKGATVITKENAEKQGKTACPVCTSSYYMTDTGKHYHLTAACSGMRGAKRVTREEALASDKTACPVCTTATGSSSSSQANYYSVKGGTYYHKASNCSGMKNAEKVTLVVAKQRNQTACPVCLNGSSSSQKYYATKSGSYYHVKSDCSGMKNATSISLSAAQKANKKACPVCISGSSTSYYATKDGQYYHKTSTCSGMKDASKITLSTAQKYNKTACPTCLGSSSAYVYMTSSGKYYHAKSGCSGMVGAKRATVATAKESGKVSCPVCIGGQVATPSPTRVTSGSSVESTTYCYASEGNKYFHRKSSCSGMVGAKRITIAEAKSRGKTVCPTCAANSPLPTKEPSVYGVSGNKYYHTKSGCSGMKNASKMTLSKAKSRNLTACPVCVKGSPSATEGSTSTRTIAASCYISSSDNYYHAKRSCPYTSSASKTTVSKAKSRGKTACTYCAGSSLDTMVFVSSKGSLYHSKSSCRNVNMDIKACLAEAVNKGYKRCSTCNAPRTTKRPAAPSPTQVVTPAPLDPD